MPDTTLGQATYSHGQHTALEVALVTFLSLMKPEVRATFCERYAKNIETFDVFTLPLPISEDWRAGLSDTAERLQGLVSRGLPPKDSDQRSS